MSYSKTSLPYKPSKSFYNERADRVQLISHEPYVALSHVWGTAEPPATTLENVMGHRTDGGLETILAMLPEPHVFRDAIDIVRGLDIHYIWIDSLCIVQNSSRSWKLNARGMDLIYGNAQMTIYAADGENGRSSLRAMHPKANNNHQHILNCETGVDLMVSRPPEAGIRASIWNSRAWTFQERLLSKRCLIFTGGRVYFQCLSTGMSEDIVADKKGAGWSLDLVQAPLQMICELERRAFWVYSRFVSLYTSRHLTKPGDILAAFDGISNLMGKTMRAPFIFGLPSSHFDMALLWEPKKALKRRKPSARNEEIDEDDGGIEFPSWAWCGWFGEEMEYQPGMVEGCTEDLHEWLMGHTWIYWYIRDGHGNLRPLWDGDRSREDQSREKRWRGYKTTNSEGDDRRYRTGTLLVRRGPPSTAQSEAYGKHDQDWSSGSDEELHFHQRTSREDSPNQIYEGEERMTKVQRDGDEDYPLGHPEITSYRKDHFRQTQPEKLTREDRQRIANDKAQCLRRGRDEYGRPIRQRIDHRRKVVFRQTLPENPYRVVMDEYSRTPDKEFPHQPILQFWTWHTSLHLVPSDKEQSDDHEGLCRYDIADEIGDWCGSLLLDQQWIGQQAVAKQEFIAISEAKSFTREECDVWTYYIEKERERSEWDLYYVLLVERKPDKACWERVALGKVFQRAFNAARWKEIVLG